MIKGTTKSGFEFELDEEIGDDFELLELMASAENNALKMGAVVEMMLGKGQKKALMEHVRNEKGRVLTSRISAEVSEMINRVSKN